jgi:hypothetical protein
MANAETHATATAKDAPGATIRPIRERRVKGACYAGALLMGLQKKKSSVVFSVRWFLALPAPHAARQLYVFAIVAPTWANDEVPETITLETAACGA